MQYHMELASRLAQLRNQGVLIVGSGNIVHNLQESIPMLAKGDNKPFDWALEFDAWVKNALESGDYKKLAGYEKAGTCGLLSVPTPDHYIPMLYSLGLAKSGEATTSIYESVEYGGIGMRCFRIG